MNAAPRIAIIEIEWSKLLRTTNRSQEIKHSLSAITVILFGVYLNFYGENNPKTSMESETKRMPLSQQMFLSVSYFRCLLLQEYSQLSRPH